jgi:hypothetical protein
MSEGNGEFKGSTTARLERIETDIREVKSDVRIMKERQDKFLGVIAVGAFAVPLILRVLFP